MIDRTPFIASPRQTKIPKIDRDDKAPSPTQTSTVHKKERLRSAARHELLTGVHGQAQKRATSRDEVPVNPLRSVVPFWGHDMTQLLGFLVTYLQNGPVVCPERVAS